MEKKIEELIVNIQVTIKKLFDMNAPTHVFENIVNGILFDINHNQILTLLNYIATEEQKENWNECKKL